MMRWGVWLSRLRVRLLLLVLIGALPALALLLYTTTQQRREATREAEAGARAAVRLVDSEVERSVGAIHDLLAVLAEVPSVRGGDMSACNALAARVVRDPRYAGVGVVDLEGRWVCSGLSVPVGASAADRSWFRRAVDSRAFTVGEYEVDRVARKPVLAFGYPLLSGDGAEPRAVLYAALDLGWLAQMLSEVPLPEGGVLTLTDRTGVVLARHPGGNGTAGQPIPEATVIRAIHGRQRDGTTEEGGPDARRLVVTFVRPRGLSAEETIYVSLALPTEVVFARANEIFVRGLFGVAAASALALVAGFLAGDVLLRRRVARLVAVTRRLGAGDLRARTGIAPGPGELGELARAVDEMADTLQRLTWQHQLILTSAGEGIYQVDRHGRIGFANPAARSLSGGATEDLIGRSVVTSPLHAPLAGAAPAWDLSPLAETLTRGVRRRVSDEAVRRPDGTVLPIEYTSAPIRENGEIVGAVVTFTDISERQRVAAELRRSRDELRRLSEYLQTMLEQERTRIAREVHDELGQALTSLKVDLVWIRDRIDRREDGRVGSLLEKLSSMAQLATATIDAIRRLTSELRPPALDYLGLAAAIQGQAQEFQRRTGVRCRVRGELEHLSIDPHRATGVFRIIQEALTNVARHAHASRVDIRVETDTDHLTFEVRDNGRGITLDQVGSETSLGLLGMRERGRLVGGEVTIAGSPNQGTAVILRIPTAKALEVAP